MLYPVITKIIIFLSETPASKKPNVSNTKISSEFPRNLFVSVLLIFFLVILTSLFIQLSTMTFGAIIQGELPFTKESMPYLLAYCLVNLLFIAHLCLYFGYKEEIKIDKEMIQIQSGYFSFQQLITLNKEQLMFSSVKENLIGNQHLKLYYCLSNQNRNKSDLHESDMDSIVIGTYLLDDQIQTIAQLLNRLSF